MQEVARVRNERWWFVGKEGGGGVMESGSAWREVDRRPVQVQ